MNIKQLYEKLVKVMEDCPEMAEREIKDMRHTEQTVTVNVWKDREKGEYTHITWRRVK